MTSAPILRNPDYSDPDRPLNLTVDASPVGCGAVLGQNDADGRRYVCRYESYRSNERERGYPQVKRELFGLKVMVKKLRGYLYAKHFVIETDARPVIGLLNKPDIPGDAASRWIAYLLLFDFTIRHIPGEDNTAADALSRDGCSGLAATTTPGNQDNQPLLFLADFYNGPYLLLGHFLANAQRPADVSDKLFKNIRKEALRHILQGGHIYRKSKDPNIAPHRVVCREEDKRIIIKSMHESEYGSHRGREATKLTTMACYYWSQLSADVSEFIRFCEVCQKQSSTRFQEPLVPTFSPALFARVGVDLLQMPKTKDGYQYIAIARDDLSDWPEAAALKSKRSKDVWQFLYRDIFARFGTVRTIIADRGELTATIVRALAADYGTQMAFTASYHPQSNGMVERGHQILIKALHATCRHDPDDWPRKLTAALWADRVTTKSTTGMSFFRMVYGHDALLPCEFKVDTWAAIQWKSEMTTQELLEARIRQLDRKCLDTELAARRLKDARNRNKVYFDAKHR